jgi:hypothetical protein
MRPSFGRWCHVNGNFIVGAHFDRRLRDRDFKSSFRSRISRAGLSIARYDPLIPSGSLSRKQSSAQLSVCPAASRREAKANLLSPSIDLTSLGHSSLLIRPDCFHLEWRRCPSRSFWQRVGRPPPLV